MHFLSSFSKAQGFVKPAPDLLSLPVYPVDYRFLTPSTGLPAGRTFLPVFHNIVPVDIFFRRFTDTFLRS